MNVVEYVMTLKDKSFGANVKKAQQQVDKLDQKVDEVNKSLSKGTVAAGIAAAAGLAIFVNKSISAFDKQVKAEAQVRQGLETTRGVAQRTFKQLTQQASALQNKTIFGDEEILKDVTSQLLTFTSISGTQFDRTQKAALDLATRLDGDLKSASIQLGKALNDPAKGMSALSRSGITFTNEQIDVIKKLQKTNQLAKAQDLILNELEKQYGGSAEAAAKAGKGGVTQLLNRLGDIQELIGKALMPIINSFASVIGVLTSFVEQNAQTFETVVQILGVAVAVIGTLIAAMQAWAAIQTVINFLLTANPIGIVIVLIGALIAAIVIAYKRSETFRGVLAGVGNVLSKIGNFIKEVIVPALKVFFNRAKEVGKSILEFLKKPIDLAVNSFKKFIGFLEKLPGVGKLIKNLRNSFSEGFKKGVKDFRKEQEKADLGVGLGGFTNTGFGGGSGSSSLIGTTASVPKTNSNKVTSAAPKQFNINITKLVEKFEVNSQNIQEAPTQIKDLITKALLESLADIEIAR